MKTTYKIFQTSKMDNEIYPNAARAFRMSYHLLRSSSSSSARGARGSFSAFRPVGRAGVTPVHILRDHFWAVHSRP